MRLVDFSKQSVGAGLRVAKRVYQSLPLSPRARAAHRRIIGEYFPALLMLSGAHRTSRHAIHSATQIALEPLRPVFVAHDRLEFERGLHREELAQIRDYEHRLIAAASEDAIVVDGFCVPCNRTVPLLAGTPRDPNWRETLTCPTCGMNNRQRLIATLIKQQLDSQRGATVYFMEQITRMYEWAVAAFPQHEVIGSEYVGDAYRSGQVIKGIRHEDATSLSFADGSIDLIVSNDVFEHVPSPEKAFAECARVLRGGGVLLATIPFYNERDASVTRATNVPSKGLQHLLPPEFHGNPMSSKGSLVFTDFGWDLLDMVRRAGLGIHVAVYVSERLAHLGDAQLVFESTKLATGSRSER